jgi:hypothetical protein
MAPGGYSILIEENLDYPAKTDGFNNLDIGLEKPKLEREFNFNPGGYGDYQGR